MGLASIPSPKAGIRVTAFGAALSKHYYIITYKLDHCLAIHAFEPPASPVVSTNSLENVTLVLFGSQHMRTSWFPCLVKLVF
jgi:hypothetical protein